MKSIRFVPIVAVLIALIAYRVSLADETTHTRSLFFVVERLSLPTLAIVALVTFVAAFRRREDRARYRWLFFLSSVSTACAGVFLATLGYLILKG